MKALYEVVKTIDVEPFEAGGGDLYRFRLEVINELNTNIYNGKVYRLETYRLQPTFPQSDGELPNWKNDALVYILDEMINTDILRGHSVEEVVGNFKKILESTFKS